MRTYNKHKHIYYTVTQQDDNNTVTMHTINGRNIYNSHEQCTQTVMLIVSYNTQNMHSHAEKVLTIQKSIQVLIRWCIA